MEVELLVEGYTDEIFVRRCFGELGISVGTVYGKKGVGYIIEKADGFSVRGQYSPILILADLADVGVACAVDARDKLVPTPQPMTLTRLAVREIESWLVASRQELAGYLGVSIARVPSDPDDLVDAKQAFINVARSSPRTRLRNMIVPQPGVSSVVGTGYVDAFAEFMSVHWSLDSAASNSPSFAKFARRCRETFAQ